MSRRQTKFFSPKLVIVFFSLLLVCAGITFVFYHLAGKYFSPADSVSQLYEHWNKNEVAETYEAAGHILDKTPFQNTALTLRGYSAFKLAVSEPDNNALTQSYLDEAINNLRVALQSVKAQAVPQIYYVLGLTYFYKNKLSSYYYYADLTTKYLEAALAAGYKSKDIPELLGLSYADLGNTDKSIASFTQALSVHESDILLYNIAKQYYRNNQGGVAKQYLVRAIQLSQDDDIVLNSHNILGRIYIDEENYDAAQQEFDMILEKNANFADAYYGLGILYEHKGDTAKARAEWRKCLKIQVNHAGAVKKLAEVKG